MAKKAGEQVKGLEEEIAALKDKLLRSTYNIGEHQETIRQLSEKLSSVEEGILEKERADEFAKLWESGAGSRFTPRGIHRRTSSPR